MPPPENTRVVIVVPRNQPDVFARLQAHFARRPDVYVRLDGRSGDRSTSRVEAFAAGGGPLPAEVLADIAAQIRIAGT
jgi:hypothetical protein